MNTFIWEFRLKKTQQIKTIVSRILQLQSLKVGRWPWKLVFSLFSLNGAVTCSSNTF